VRLSVILVALWMGILTGACGAGTLEEARTLLASDALPEAIACLEGGLREAPEDLELRMLLGEALSRSGRYRASFMAYREVLGMRPGDPLALARLRGSRRPLVRELRRTLKVRPGDVPALHALAFLLILEGKVEKGRRQLLGLTRKAPGYAAGWNDLGWSRLAKKDWEGAYRNVSRAFELDPGSPLIRHHLGLLRELRKQKEKPAGEDPLFGILNQPQKRSTSGSAPSGPLIPPAATLPSSLPTGTAPQFDFGKVNLEDDALVASLLARIEKETLGPQESTPVTTKAMEPPPDLLVPTPLEVLKKIQESFDQGVRAAQEYRFQDAEQAFRLVLSLKPHFQDTEARLREVRARLGDLDRLEEGRLRLDAGDGARAASMLALVPRKFVQEVQPELDMDALLGRANFLSQSWARAEGFLRKAVGRTPQDAELRYSLFLCLVNQDKVSEALQELNILDSVRPGFAARKQGHRKLVMRLYVKRYFFWIAGLAVLWILAGVGYMAFFGRRKVRGDFYGTHVEDIQEALRLEDFTRAKGLLDELESMKLEGERAQRALSLKASMWIGLGKFEESEACIEELETEGGVTSSTRLLRGRVFLGRERVDQETLPFLRELLRAEPSHRPLLELLHEKSWAEQDLSDESHEVLTRLLGLDPDNPEYILRETIFLADRKELSEGAILHYRRTLQMDAKNFPAARWLAEALLGMGQTLDALELLRRALKHHPSSGELQELASRAYQKLELLEEGISLFEGLVERNVGEVALRELQVLKRLQDQNLVQEARSREDEKKVGGTYDEGVQLYSKGSFAEAIPLLEAAKQVEAYRLHAGALLVKSQLGLGEVERAREAFDSLEVGDSPTDEFMLGLCYDMARALQDCSDYVGARNLFRMVCRADVDYRDAFERFEELEEQLLLSS
jgi:tetratricopeptide (TPR) repeat protein